MRKIHSLLCTVVLSTFAASAMAADAASKAALTIGGTNLVNLQNSKTPNSDGGWFFGAGDADCGFGPDASCPNTFGITALGLVSAYEITHTPAFKAAALNTADALVDMQTAAPDCDGDPATSADRGYTADVAFLLLGAQKLSGAPKYRNAAMGWFQCVEQDFPAAADRADERINRRIAGGLNNLGAWDAALDIRAANAFQTRAEAAYALAEGRQVILRHGDWYKEDPDCPGCEYLSKGLMLNALWGQRGSSTELRNTLQGWANDLVSKQNADGSWGPQDTQVTAYVVLGLRPIDTAASKNAVNRGVAFLISQQNLNGGFNVVSGDPTEYTEVDSEILQAIGAAY